MFSIKLRGRWANRDDQVQLHVFKAGPYCFYDDGFILVYGPPRLQREIELLREYRTCLVADVVTGKLDVCEVAAHLPDDATLDRVEDDTELSDETETADEEAAV